MKLNKHQAIVVMGYTGYSACNFSLFHEDVEKRLGRPVFTHEFASEAMRDTVKELYKADFIAMCLEE